MTLVNSPFDGRGYPGWRRSVLITLSAKNKIGFISGVCVEPDLGSKEHPHWSRTNDMVTSWLLNSLSKEIGDSVIYSKTAQSLWNNLEHRFGQSNGAKLYHVQKEIAKSVQGNSSIAGYFTTLKRLWDELDSLNSHLGCTCNCTCQGKTKMAKFLEDQRIIQFLMGLNDSYAHARGRILMMNSLPNIDHAYSILLQDEGQREIYLSPHYPTDGATFMANTQNKIPQRNNNHKGWIHHKSMVINSRNSREERPNSTLMKEQKWKSLQMKELTPNEGTGNNQNQFFSKEQVPLMRRGQVFGGVRDGLYLLQPSSIESSFLPNQNVVSIPKGSNSTLVSSLVSLSKAVYVNTISDVKDWHVRLGHLPFQYGNLDFPIKFKEQRIFSIKIFSKLGGKTVQQESEKDKIK
uniref:Uncharacterized protein LOC104236793 n=1 Tax=Nicotiana sylvestris TaxID=4096 RepID=A0A1U7XQA1_NICSY|nr:PREDICTED: uncharacterized protein LOC104236793 [Nicotiana sylvestris]